ncbi:MAG: HK97 family phage prohead protease [Actinomycetaceae bacterium]|nr:HK97 family phage prohead protease [Arcanobacterium sp.]MDD7504736.1 HK97 family phage prohead protease [Actinomycetaceae bacterium]MDY6142741.1 HK97 family phage prohead protease [Arcanobacterium sp.]
MKLQYRQATLTTPADTGLHTLSALAVPYSEDFTEIAPGIFERFTPGAIQIGEHAPKLRYEHEHTIGQITSSESRDDGFYIDASISDTTLGRDVAAMLADGTLTKCSIGFMPDTATMQATTDEAGNMYITHEAATLFEVSIVSFPAYTQTSITEFRSLLTKGENPMNTRKTSPEVHELDDITRMLDDHARTIARLGARLDEQAQTASPLMDYRSAGDYMKAYASSPEVRELAETAATSEDATLRPGWLNRELALMAAKQPVTQAFTHLHNLPSEGMSFDYPKIKANTLTVAEQAAEGDTLVTGKLELTAGNVPVNTFGGYTLITRQMIDRATPQYLSTVHSALNIQYANAIEAKTQAELKKTLTANVKTTEITSSLAALSLTVDELIGLTLDLIDYYENELIYPLTGIGVSPDLFRYLATVKEDAKAFAFNGAPADKIGTLSIRTRTGESTEITVTRFPVAATGEKLMFGYSSAALEINEAPNAPLRLDDQRENTNLTNVFSVYGYATHAVIAPEAIVPVTFSDTVSAEA